MLASLRCGVRTRDGDPCREATAPNRDDHSVDVWDLLQDLEPDGALPGHDGRVRKGVEVYGAGPGDDFKLIGFCLCVRISEEGQEDCRGRERAQA